VIRKNTVTGVKIYCNWCNWNDYMIKQDKNQLVMGQFQNQIRVQL